MIRKHKFLLLPVLALAAGVLGSGCQALLLGPVAMIELLFPKSREPAEFKLPAGKTVLVFPDDMLRPVSYPPVKRALAERICKTLKDKKLVANAVPYDSLIDLQHNEANFNRMAVASVGRRLGADLVIYINIGEFSLKDSPVGTLWSGRFAAKVRVVDVRKGRIWPDESAGYPVRIVEPMTDNSSESFGALLSLKLAGRLADEVSGLFHTRYVDRHRPKDTEPRWEE
ncbi:hypothetical protein LCGC14_2029910 [marine sediment metagenome]|uniref:Uncharacterized protein n=1 Tax=marine sediment metagenome TaxID=412755 RepID=A0A0F9EV58_9ZZZZ